MINWFNIPDEGLSNGGLFEVKELEVTENGTYETKGEMYNKVNVNVEGGGGESDFSTAQVTVNSSTSLMYKLCLSNYYDYENTGIIIPEIASGNIDTSITLNAVLYKGQAMCIFTPLSANTPNISVSGNIQNVELMTYIITGDCTITIS